MKKEDGTGRVIYGGPGGQLIGSLKPPQTINVSAAGGSTLGTPASTLAGANQPQPGASPGQAPAGGQAAGTTPGAAGGRTPANPSGGGQGGSAVNTAPPPRADSPVR